MMQAVLPSHFRMRMLPGFSRMLWENPERCIISVEQTYCPIRYLLSRNPQ